MNYKTPTVLFVTTHQIDEIEAYIRHKSDHEHQKERKLTQPAFFLFSLKLQLGAKTLDRDYSHPVDYLYLFPSITRFQNILATICRLLDHQGRRRLKSEALCSILETHARR